MPEYFIIDAGALRAAVVSRQNTSGPKAAVEAVPRAVALPQRVVVIARDDVHDFFVAAEGADLPEVVERPAAPEA